MMNRDAHRQLTTRDFVQCRDCGTTMVVWVRSPRTDRNYLADAAITREGSKATPRPHFKTCTKVWNPITV